MAVCTMEVLVLSPITAPSSFAPQTLETIPGSASATPPNRSIQSTPVETSIRDVFGDQAEAGPSRLTPLLARQPSLAPSPAPTSYFSLPPGAASPATTPWDRPRPPTLDIPPGTPDDPLFSNYPSTAPSRAPSISGSTPYSVTALAESPRIRRKSKSRHQEQEEDDGNSSGSTSPTSPGLWWKKKSKGRRRANTLSHSPPKSPTSPSSPVRPRMPIRVSSLMRRRASVGSAPYGLELQGEDAPMWSSMPQEEVKRIRPEPAVPFTYPQPRTPSIKQSPSSPNVTPRRSSLAGAMSGLQMSSPSHHSLGLTGVNTETTSVILIPEDDSIPHDPPPRRSSLSFGPDTIIGIKALSPVSPGPLSPDTILSASLSTTESSAFSPSSSGPHPLSSATTSLSRSAKSGKDEGEKDPALSAIRLQRSLEWEAKQTRHRRKLEKRRMILLELVETEVAYAEDLKALVQVYLPQLHALPSVPERTALAVGRNAAELLRVHSGLSICMVEILKEEGLGYEMLPEEDLVGKVERVSRKLAAALDDNEAPAFSAYNEFCAGSVMANTLVRNISLRTDYTAFERRCQYISSSQPNVKLQDLLDETLPANAATNKNRLHFRDYLIMPIQRVCRYPLLLAALLGAADTPTPSSEHASFLVDDGAEFDIGVDVERALGAMRGVAEEADDARRRKESEIKTATVLSRLEPHPQLTQTFLRSLGPCRLIGSLDVLHHHPSLAPLLPPVKVKYLAAFLYRGYLVLAKVKKGKVYEAKHFLPLGVFELIDIAEGESDLCAMLILGYLPHSVRLSLREHSFDLAASCEAEKAVWAAALISAREDSTASPFEFPASVSPFAARARRMSITAPPSDMSPVGSPPNKRHTLGSPPTVTPSGSLYELHDALDGTTTTGQTILLRRATPNQRLTVDRALLDVFSESCAQARSKAQMHHALFLPEGTPETSLALRESTLLRRRRSFLESKQHRRSSSNVDIAFSGEVKGSIIPIRPSKSFAGSDRSSLPRANRPRRSSQSGSVRGTEESATEMDADDTATSDFGTLRGGGGRTRGNSLISASPTISPLKSTLSSFRPGLEPINSAALIPTSHPTGSPLSANFATASAAPTRFVSLRRSVRKSASVVNFNARAPVPHRAMSTPSSPLLRAVQDQVAPVKRSSSDPDRLTPTRKRTDGGGDEDIPPLPAPRGSDGTTLEEGSSSSNRGVSRSDSSSSSRPSDGSNPVYALGNGLTNNPDRIGSGPWGTLKRTLTSSRSQRNSMVSLDDLGGSPVSVRERERDMRGREKEAERERERTPSQPAVHSRSSSFADEGEDGEEGIMMGAPRRRRSVRILQSIRGFTAM